MAYYSYFQESLRGSRRAKKKEQSFVSLWRLSIKESIVSLLYLFILKRKLLYARKTLQLQLLLLFFFFFHQTDPLMNETAFLRYAIHGNSKLGGGVASATSVLEPVTRRSHRPGTRPV